MDESIVRMSILCKCKRKREREREREGGSNLAIVWIPVLNLVKLAICPIFAKICTREYFFSTFSNK